MSSGAGRWSSPSSSSSKISLRSLRIFAISALKELLKRRDRRGLQRAAEKTSPVVLELRHEVISLPSFVLPGIVGGFECGGAAACGAQCGDAAQRGGRAGPGGASRRC